MTKDYFISRTAEKWRRKNLESSRFPKNLNDFWRVFHEIAIPELELNTAQRQASFLAQVAHECDLFQTLEEYASGAAYEGRKDLGNNYAGDGKRYKGRGYIQLTGRHNYRKFNDWYKKKEPGAPDLLCQPQLISYHPELAMWATVYYWQTRNLNQWSDKGWFKTLTRRINGGLNGYQHRLDLHKMYWPMVNRNFTKSYKDYA